MNVYPKDKFDSPIHNTKSTDLTIYRLRINRSFRKPVGVRMDVKENENNQKEIILSARSGGLEPVLTKKTRAKP